MQRNRLCLSSSQHTITFTPRALQPRNHRGSLSRPSCLSGAAITQPPRRQRRRVAPLLCLARRPAFGEGRSCHLQMRTRCERAGAAAATLSRPSCLQRRGIFLVSGVAFSCARRGASNSCGWVGRWLHFGGKFVLICVSVSELVPRRSSIAARPSIHFANDMKLARALLLVDGRSIWRRRGGGHCRDIA